MTAARSSTRFDMQELLGEMERYLDAVRVFREEGCEPHWTPEAPAVAVEPEAVQLPLFVAD